MATGRSGTCHEHEASSNLETRIANEEIDMTVTLGLLAQLQARPGKGDEL